MNVKKQLLQLINAVHLNSNFRSRFELTVNYVSFTPYDFLNDYHNAYKHALEQLGQIEEVKNFNLTIEDRGGVENGNYAPDWYLTRLIFYSGQADVEDEAYEYIKHPQKYSMFEFEICGAPIIGNIKSFEVLRRFEGKDQINQNYFEYEKAGELLVKLLTLQETVKHQAKKKAEIIESLRLEI